MTERILWHSSNYRYLIPNRGDEPDVKTESDGDGESKSQESPRSKAVKLLPSFPDHAEYSGD